MDQSSVIPAPPPGFVLEPTSPAPPAGSSVPLPPEGFVLETPSAPAVEEPKRSGLAANVYAGTYDTIASIVGAPVDAAKWLMANSPRTLLGGEKTDLQKRIAATEPVGGKESIKSGMGAIGMPSIDAVESKTIAEKAARGAAAGAMSGALPVGVAGVLGKAGALAPSTVEGISGFLSSAKSLPGALWASTVDAAAGGGAGASAGIAEKAGLSEGAQTAAGILGGLGAGMGTAGLGSVIKSTAGLSKSARDAAQKARAAEILADVVKKDAQTRRQAAQELAEKTIQSKADLIPDSKPTLFQQTGEQSVGQLERSLQTADVAPFKMRRDEQQLARLKALNTLNPEGQAEAVTDFLRSKLRDIDDEQAALVGLAGKAAREGVESLGAGRAPEVVGAELQGALGAERAAAQAPVREAVTAVAPDIAPDAAGAATRGVLKDAATASKRVKDELWRRLEGVEDIAVSTKPLKKAVDSLRREMTRMSPAVGGDTGNIMGLIEGAGKVASFKDIFELRKNINAARAAAVDPRGMETPDSRRLSIIMDSLEKALSESAPLVISKEAQDIASGALSEADSIVGAMRRIALDEVDEAGLARTAGSGGVGPGAGGSGIAANRARGPGETGSDLAPGSSGLQEDVLGQGALDAARAKLRAANEASRTYKKTYREGPIGDVLKQRAFGRYAIDMDANVVPRLIKPGASGAETIRAYRQAVGNDPASMQSLADAGAVIFRNEASKDGFVDVGALAKFRDKYADTLREFPELDARLNNVQIAQKSLARLEGLPPSELSAAAVPGTLFRPGAKSFDDITRARKILGEQQVDAALSDFAVDRLMQKTASIDYVSNPKKFADAIDSFKKTHADAIRAVPGLSEKLSTPEKALRSFDEALSAKQTAIDEFQSSEIGRLLKVDHPRDIENEVGRVLGRTDSVKAARAVYDRVKESPDAVEGLRKATADWIGREFVSNTEVGTTGGRIIRADKFKEFVKDKRDALEIILGKDRVGLLNRIADDLTRSDRSISATKMPGGPGTAQDIAALDSLRANKAADFVDMLSTGALLSTPGTGAAGLASTGAGKIVSGMLRRRAMGTERALAELVLNPELARQALLGIPDSPDRLATFGRILSRVAIPISASIEANE